MVIQENVSLANLCWFKVGGLARYYCTPSTISEVKKALDWANEKKVFIYFLGNGSNIIFSDDGFDGLIIHTKPLFDQFQFEDQVLSCQSGAFVYQVVQACVKNGLGGFEKLVGVPGTIGGGITINAGAYGQEFSDTLIKVLSCDLQGNLIERNLYQCEMEYRYSVFCKTKEIVLQAWFQLKPQTVETLKNNLRDSLLQRKKTQPLNFPNAGSIFKKHQGISAGKIIEDLGLKGLQVGKAQISEKHANFIINLGFAKAQDIYNLAIKVKDKVKKELQINLELEVRFVGKF